MDRTISQQSTFIDQTRDFATALTDLIDKSGHVLQLEWNGGMNALLTDSAAFAGTPHTKEDITAVFVTIDALMTLMAAGHRDNLYNVRK